MKYDEARKMSMKLTKTRDYWYWADRADEAGDHAGAEMWRKAAEGDDAAIKWAAEQFAQSTADAIGHGE